MLVAHNFCEFLKQAASDRVGLLRYQFIQMHLVGHSDFSSSALYPKDLLSAGSSGYDFLANFSIGKRRTLAFIAPKVPSLVASVRVSLCGSFP
jgi:hypothetical protein